MAARRKCVTKQAEEGADGNLRARCRGGRRGCGRAAGCSARNGAARSRARDGWQTELVHGGIPDVGKPGWAQRFASLETRIQQQLLDDESAQTAVEREDGHLPAIRVKQARGRLPSVAQLAAVFDECVGPAKLEASTRKGYQAAWRLVLTWGIDHECVGDLLPMTLNTLKAS
jgi:hypothetical protein